MTQESGLTIPNAKQTIAAAEAALQRADATELHRLFLRERAQSEELIATMQTLMTVYAGNSKDPRTAQSPEAIQAMRDVAIAAIELATAALPKGQS